MRLLKWGIYIIVFSLPLYLVRFKVFGVPTTALEVMIYVLFVVWLIKGSNFSELGKIIKENRLLFLAIFLILFGVGLATIHSWDLGLSAGILKAWFLMSARNYAFQDPANTMEPKRFRIMLIIAWGYRLRRYIITE